jgi:hypothetical protein
MNKIESLRLSNAKKKIADENHTPCMKKKCEKLQLQQNTIIILIEFLKRKHKQ